MIVPVNSFGGKAEIHGSLNYIPDVALDKKGNLYAVDYYNYKVSKFSSQGKALIEFGELGADPGELNYPNRIAVDNKGNIFVLDWHDLSLVSSLRGDQRSYYRVQKFDAKGNFQWSVGGPGNKSGQTPPHESPDPEV